MTRARITLSAVIGRTERIQKAGREFKACCPFHRKTPSFTINDERAYHCFGCGARMAT
jgi:DNA primase